MPSLARRHALQPPFVFLWTLSIFCVLMYSFMSCGSLSITYQTPYSFPVHYQTSPNVQHQPFSSPHKSIMSYQRNCSDPEASPNALGAMQAVPTAAEVLQAMESQWGPSSCVVLRNACMDEGTFVTFGDNPYARQYSSSSSRYYASTNITTTTSSSSSGRRRQLPWHAFKLGNHHLDFRGFGDVAGIVQYPSPIIRPGNGDEEAPDLRQPVTFSHCVRPVVLYLNFVYMYGDWWLRTMPTFMHALAAGAWDRRYDVIVATGGQKLERWQKLVLQTLTDKPLVTLSAASSRALATQGYSNAAVDAARVVNNASASTALDATEALSAATAAGAAAGDLITDALGSSSSSSRGDQSGRQQQQEDNTAAQQQQQQLLQDGEEVTQQQQQQNRLLQHTTEHISAQTRAGSSSSLSPAAAAAAASRAAQSTNPPLQLSQQQQQRRRLQSSPPPGPLTVSGPKPQQGVGQPQQQQRRKRRLQSSPTPPLLTVSDLKPQQGVAQQHEQQQQQRRRLLQSSPPPDPVTVSEHTPHGVAAVGSPSPPVTAHGRCFELLSICSVPDARTFPLLSSSSSGSSDGDGGSNDGSNGGSSGSVVPRETWSGAQYVKQYYMERYGQQYHYLLPQHRRLQEKGAFRVVFAVRPPAAAAAAAAAAAGVEGSGQEALQDSKGSSSDISSSSDSSSSTTFGVQNPTEAQLASSTRQLLNIEELLRWCNSWVPAAADSSELEGIDSSSTAAMAAAGGGGGGSSSRRRYSHTVCVAHKFGRHGRVDIPARTAASSSSSGSNGGWWSKGAGTFGAAARKVGEQAKGGRTHQQQQQQQQQQGERGSRAVLDEQQQQWPWSDPDLDPRALMTDLAVVDNADVLVGVHGAQLYNALFMPQHKALVEIRTHGFWGGWPKTYFYDPLVKVDKDDGILWWGVDTINASNARPGRWEREGVGVAGTYARDRHTRVEPAALELLFRRILWSSEDPQAYKELKYADLTHITDTLQPAQQYHTAQQKAAAAAAQQQLQQHRQRPEVAAAVAAAKAAGLGGG